MIQLPRPISSRLLREASTRLRIHKKRRKLLRKHNLLDRRGLMHKSLKRERILRRLYQKLRVGNQGSNNGPKSLNNNLYLAQFLLRKGVLNHFVNGILINREIAENEETRLQMTIGQMIVKTMILCYNEIQGIGT